jgi:hypothetical protein
MAAGDQEGTSLLSTEGPGAPMLINQGKQRRAPRASLPLGNVYSSKGDLQRHSEGENNPPERALQAFG